MAIAKHTQFIRELEDQRPDNVLRQRKRTSAQLTNNAVEVHEPANSSNMFVKVAVWTLTASVGTVALYVLGATKRWIWNSYKWATVIPRGRPILFCKWNTNNIGKKWYDSLKLIIRGDFALHYFCHRVLLKSVHVKSMSESGIISVYLARNMSPTGPKFSLATLAFTRVVNELSCLRWWGQQLKYEHKLVFMSPPYE